MHSCELPYLAALAFQILGIPASTSQVELSDSVPKEEHRLYMAMLMSLKEWRAERFMSSGFQRAETAKLGKWKLPESVSACNLLLKKWICAFSIELEEQLQLSQTVYWKRGIRFRFLRFGLYTVPAVPVPTVHKLFDFLRFGSTVPVRFQNLHDSWRITINA